MTYNRFPFRVFILLFNAFLIEVNCCTRCRFLTAGDYQPYFISFLSLEIFDGIFISRYPYMQKRQLRKKLLVIKWDIVSALSYTCVLRYLLDNMGARYK